MAEGNTWYKSWFDTPYYHILYRHRDDNEAQVFIKNAIDELKPPTGSHILDLACGRGRHARFLNELGFTVTGIDLSQSNINYAQKHHTSKGLQFEVGDMRQPYGTNRFEYIFNLFTSFGYFDSWEDDLQALKMMKQALKPGGTLVLDFMNVNKVKMGLVTEEVRQVKGIEFHIERFIRNGMVIKKISFEADHQTHEYEEQVQLLNREDFQLLLTEAGFKITAFYGDFNLGDFHARDSERLILFAR
jgi:2-polyprenyl-3-methyl-5-hydroxy-6-metoxy-1,4-benzoquinol methylase